MQLLDQADVHNAFGFPLIGRLSEGKHPGSNVCGGSASFWYQNQPVNKQWAKRDGDTNPSANSSLNSSKIFPAHCY